jgi:hypothetical protein
MTVIFTCFAGRERYLKILIPYIEKLVGKKLVDEVHLWDYTRDPKDAEYIRSTPFTIMVPETKMNFGDYYKYYRSSRYPDPDTVLIKCDDDIVFIDTDRFEDFIKIRRKTRDAVFMSASVVNNPVCGMVQIQRGVLPGFKPSDVDIASDGKKIHKYFLKNRKMFMKDSLRTERLSQIPCDAEWRFNINFIAILARDFDWLFESPYLAEDDECYLGVYAPRYFRKFIYIDMHFIVAHMAYTTQRNAGLDEAPLLARYKETQTSLRGGF